MKVQSHYSIKVDDLRLDNEIIGGSDSNRRFYGRP